MEWVHTLKHLRLPNLRLPTARKDMGISERGYVHAEPPQPPPQSLCGYPVNRSSWLPSAARETHRDRGP